MSEMRMPPDSHVHTEFSWDAASRGSMVESCERAVALGLPSVAFTEHVDLTPWTVPPEAVSMFPEDMSRWIGDDQMVHAPLLDFDGYFDSIECCRSAFPSLRILTGLEIGEPHWFPDITRDLLTQGPFERVLGSLHSINVNAQPRLIDEWFHSDQVAGDVEAQALRDYLSEAIRMIEASDVFEVFAHIDYLVRQIADAGRSHDPRPFEAEYRETLEALARADRILEISTKIPLDPLIVRWWYEVGGQAVSFGSDAHTGSAVGAGFPEAAAMAEAIGFRPQADPHDFWRR